MKIQAMSDLHLKAWGPNRWQQFLDDTRTDADVLVLAGDIVDLNGRDWLWSVARMKEFRGRYPHVVYVPGNHEFYGTAIADIDLKEFERQTGVTVLTPTRTVTLGDQRFMGGVMFQPWSRSAPPISDHSCIRDFKQEARLQYAALRLLLEEHLTGDDIVVTHHAPSSGSIAPEWRGDPHNRWFITHEMEELIVARQPRLWIHGHVHTPFDYWIYKSRVIANPRGYPGEGVKFDPKKIIELD